MLRICLRRKIVARDHDAQALGFFGLVGEIKASGQDRGEMLRTRTYCHYAILSQNGEQEPEKTCSIQARAPMPNQNHPKRVVRFNVTSNCGE